MFEINIKNKLSLKIVKEKLSNYVATCDTPNFYELINLLGVTWSEWVEYEKNLSNVVVRLLVRYKEYLEGQMEKLLIYQTKRYYNYKHLEFVLAKSNPLKYGAVRQVKEDKNKNKIAKFELGNDLVNVSEVKLLNVGK